MNEKLINVEEADKFFKELRIMPLVQQFRIFYKVIMDKESKDNMLKSPLMKDFISKIKKYVFHTPSIYELIKNGASDEEIELFITSEEFFEKGEKLLELKIYDLIQDYKERSKISQYYRDDKELKRDQIRSELYLEIAHELEYLLKE